MAKELRQELSGKEARYILKKNNINQAWLAEQLGIKAQSLTSRLNASVFKIGYQMEINKLLNRRIFDIDDTLPTVANDANRVPVLDLRAVAGFDVVALEDNETQVSEYVTMQGLHGCVGIYVYGDSMSPEYRSGDIIFVRKVPEVDNIAYGRPYLVITKDERVLKCIYKSNHDADCLRLTSLNEDVNRHGDRLYPDREVLKENILFLYRVEGLFRREQM